VRANEALARRPKPPPPACPTCGTPPLTAQGFPDLNIAPVRRWWCPEHRDQAAPGDLDPPSSGIRADMTPIPSDAEVERDSRADARRAEEDRQRREERALRAREAREVARLRDEQRERELFGGRT
jgi:hypothetical protein